MKKVNLYDFIVPTKNKNPKTGVETEDLIYVDSKLDERAGFATDWALGIKFCTNEGRKFTPFDSLRSHIPVGKNKPAEMIDSINYYGNELGFSPLCTQLDAQMVIEAQKSENNFKIVPEKNRHTGKVNNVIEFGSYPNSHVGPILNSKLTALWEKNKLVPTGKEHACCVRPDRSFGFPEFEYKGEKFTFLVERYSVVNVKDIDNEGKIRKEEQKERLHWYRVEPIQWEIENWDELPKQINPNGTGEAKTIKISTKESVMYWDLQTTFNPLNWEESPARAYLNLVPDDKNPENKPEKIFLSQALDAQINLERSEEKETGNQPGEN